MREMICSKCGFIFSEGLFCPECGTKYELETTENNQNTVIEEKRQIVQEQASTEMQEKDNKKDKLNNRRGIWALVLGVISWIAVLTIFVPLICGMISIVKGIKALRGRTKYKKCAVAGVILSVLVYILLVWAFLQPSSNTGDSVSTSSSTLEENVMSARGNSNGEVGTSESSSDSVMEEETLLNDKADIEVVKKDNTQEGSDEKLVNDNSWILYSVYAEEDVVKLFLDENDMLSVWCGNEKTNESYYTNLYDSYTYEDGILLCYVENVVDEYCFGDNGGVEVLLSGYGSNHYQSYIIDDSDNIANDLQFNVQNEEILQNESNEAIDVAKTEDNIQNTNFTVELGKTYKVCYDDVYYFANVITNTDNTLDLYFFSENEYGIKNKIDYMNMENLELIEDNSQLQKVFRKYRDKDNLYEVLIFTPDDNIHESAISIYSLTEETNVYFEAQMFLQLNEYDLEYALYGEINEENADYFGEDLKDEILAMADGVRVYQDELFHMFIADEENVGKIICFQAELESAEGKVGIFNVSQGTEFDRVKVAMKINNTKAPMMNGSLVFVKAEYKGYDTKNDRLKFELIDYVLTRF